MNVELQWWHAIYPVLSHVGVWFLALWRFKSKAKEVTDGLGLTNDSKRIDLHVHVHGNDKP